MVKQRRSFSSSDESTWRRSKLLSPRTPKNTQNKQFFDFTKTTTTKTSSAKGRSVSWSSYDTETTTTVTPSKSFRRDCRKYTINSEVAEQLAQIGDEIMRDYGNVFRDFNLVSLYQFFNVTTGVKRRRPARQNRQHQQEETSNRRKISGYLGILLLHFVSSL